MNNLKNNKLSLNLAVYNYQIKKFILFLICGFVLSCNKSNPNLEKNNSLFHSGARYNKFSVDSYYYHFDSLEFNSEYYSSTIIRKNDNDFDANSNQIYIYKKVAHNIEVDGRAIVYNGKSSFINDENLSYEIYEYNPDADETAPYIHIRILNNRKNNSHQAFYIKLVQPSHFNDSIRTMMDALMLERNNHLCRIITNLPEYFIRKQFPNFIGDYHYLQYKKINIDYSYPIGTAEFYKHIEFIE